MISLPPTLKKQLNQEKKHKYGAIRSQCLYKHDHDSRKEADWCVKLHELEKEGKIRDLVLKPIFVLTVNGVPVCNHIPDFHCFENGIETVYEVKGMQTKDWILKKKLFCALYPKINYIVV